MLQKAITLIPNAKKIKTMKLFTTSIAILFLAGNNIAQNYNFSKITSNTIDSVGVNSICFFDADNDGDVDYIQAGEGYSYNFKTTLYFNNGNGIFTPSTDTLFPKFNRGDIKFADVNNDNYNDLLIIGFDDSYQKLANLYLNDGTGHFQLSTTTSFFPVHQGAVAFADFNNDNSQDVIISGNDTLGNPNTNLYLNNGLGIFTRLYSSIIDSVHYSSVDVADVENDGDIDIVVSGLNTQGNIITKLFLNDGLANFTLDNATNLDGAHFGTVKFADLNNDNHIDLLVSGDNDGIGNIVTDIYSNDGSGNFSLEASTGLIGAKFNTVSIADLNGDDLPEIFIGGDTTLNGDRANILYNNMGNFNFTINTQPITSANFSSHTYYFVDIDNDSDNDLYCNQMDNNYSFSSYFYRNNRITLGIDEIKKEIKIYPNPTTGKSILDISLEDNVQLSIYASNGRLITRKIISSTSGYYSLDLTSQPQGIYYINLSNANINLKTIVIKQ